MVFGKSNSPGINILITITVAEDGINIISVKVHRKTVFRH